MARKDILLQRGLSDFYVSKCFDAYANGLITKGYLSEMLLINSSDLSEIAKIYNINF